MKRKHWFVFTAYLTMSLWVPLVSVLSDRWAKHRSPGLCLLSVNIATARIWWVTLNLFGIISTNTQKHELFCPASQFRSFVMSFTGSLSKGLDLYCIVFIIKCHLEAECAWLDIKQRLWEPQILCRTKWFWPAEGADAWKRFIYILMGADRDAFKLYLA